jgi:hypothetical protein
VTQKCECNEGYEYMDFTDMDADSSGFLNLTEYRTALRKLDFISESDLETRFDDVDHNGDGRISLEEYKIFDIRETIYMFHCTLCPSTTYKDVQANSRCTACPYNYSWTRMGAVSLDECICDFGTTGMPPYQTCEPCPSGTYKPYPGPYLCELCDANHYGSGPEKHTQEEACIKCPPFSNSSQASPSIRECHCRAGYYKQTALSMNCTACEPGKYSDVNNTIGGCTDCPEDEITELPAQTACVCRVGKFRTGSDECADCRANTYKDAAGDDIELCLSCPPFSRSVEASTNRSACICRRGFYAENLVNGDDCLVCPNGTIKPDVGPQACDECPRGRVPNPSRIECWCQEDTYSNYSTGACDDCTLFEDLPDGCPRWPPHYWTDCVSDDTEMPDGTLILTTDGKCNVCSEFLRCPAGFYYVACEAFRDARCVRCGNPIPANAHYSTAGDPKDIADTCKWECNQGYQLAVHQNGYKYCQPCPKGTYSSRVTTACTSCPHLTTTLSEGSESCIACRTGYYRHALGDDGHAICIECQPQATTRGGIALSPHDCYCGPGFHGYSWQCRACPRGTYKPSVSVTPDSQRRQMNALALPATDTCVPCAANTYSTLRGATSASTCTACPPKSTSGPGDDECVCIQGYFDTDAGKLAECRACPMNTYNPALGALGVAACQRCPDANSYSPPGSPSPASCICNAGYQGNGSACQACPPNTYATLNDTVCLPCPAQTFAEAASTSLLDCFCEAGFYGSPLVPLSCTPCPALSTSQMGANRHESDCFCTTGHAGQPGTQGRPCEPCASANTYPHESTEYCSCNAGFFGSPREGTACAPCPQHSHSAEAARSRGACTCDAGFYGNLSDAAQQCEQCPSHSSSLERTLTLGDCVCNAGFSGDVGGGGACSRCPSNAFTWAPNRCTCNAGFYKSLTAALVECQACPANSFNSRHSQEGASACLPCPPNSTSDVAAVSIADCR